jgi:hypothetical protein
MDYWWGTIHRHIWNRTRAFWWANAVFAGTVSVLCLVFGRLEDDPSIRSSSLAGAIGMGAFTLIFFVGGLFAPRD